MPLIENILTTIIIMKKVFFSSLFINWCLIQRNCSFSIENRGCGAWSLNSTRYPFFAVCVWCPINWPTMPSSINHRRINNKQIKRSVVSHFSLTQSLFIMSPKLNNKLSTNQILDCIQSAIDISISIAFCQID